jgi:C-terminal processing protease CtpA/Prc
MQFGFHDHYDIVFISPKMGSLSTKMRLKPVSLDKMKTEHWIMKHELKCNPAENYALLTLNSFSSYPSLEHVKKFIDDSFARIANNKIGNLVIDLRGNTGGDPNIAAHLLSYIEPEEKIYFNEPYKDYEGLAKPIPMAARNRFLGNIYTLTDGEGFSTTGHFCSLLKYHRIGVLIGEELGSTYTCNDNSQNLVLKNTGFKVKMPTQSYAVAVENIPDDRGILPDYVVAATIEDVLSGKDTVFEFALNLIRKK